MIRIVRAAGLTAAALALVAGASLSAPSEAHERGTSGSAVQSQESGLLSGFVDRVVSAFTPEGAPAAAAEAAAPADPKLEALVAANAADATSDAEQECLARAVYFESRGEPIDGQLAVADVVLNRVVSRRYPDTICAVVTQHAQFSFIQNGRFPTPDKATEAWRKAVAIAKIATADIVDAVPADVMWYHADYVAPAWGKQLNRESKIGLHIFYS
ncbi:MAG: cell wall hydrolase [Alphaproteobacteria bacterium]|nr:MAG: cell wall hydrolase [Alphaproteobacteria bacterium]